jgi:hypothetical protein
MLLCCCDPVSAAKRGHFECFKERVHDGRNWKPDTVIECVKHNQFEMYCYVICKQANSIEHPTIPPDIWNVSFSDEVLVTHAILHRNMEWSNIIIRANERISNVRRIKLIKLALQHANVEACDILVTKLRDRTTDRSRQIDLKQYMECAVYSRNINTIQWVERTFNTSSTTPWILEWRQNANSLMSALIKNKTKHYALTYMMKDVFEYIFSTRYSKCVIIDYDTIVEIVLTYHGGNWHNHIDCLFRAVWYKVCDRCDKKWKLYCIRYNKIAALGYIHGRVQEWPDNFITICDSAPGALQSNRTEIKRWAILHGCNTTVRPKECSVSHLHKMMELIEQMKDSTMGGYEEVLYLEACKVMQQLHREIVV